MRYIFQPSDDFFGDFPDTDINTTLNIPMVEIRGAEIEREDVIGLYDQATQEHPGFWVMAAGQHDILSFGSCKIVAEHNWPQPLI